MAINSYLIFVTQCMKHDVPTLTRNEWEREGSPSFKDWVNVLRSKGVR